MVERLFVQHHVRLDHAPAAAAGDADALRDLLGGIEGAAIHADIAPNAAVQFEHGMRARLLVQSVNILGDDGGKPALPLPLRQLIVGGVGLRIQAEHLFAVEFKKLFRMPVEKGAREDVFGRVFVLLAVQPVLRAEIGDAAFGADPRPAEKYHLFGRLHDLAQAGNAFLSCIHLFDPLSVF